MFAYCSNNPITSYDPDGTFAICFPFVAPVIGVIVGAVVALAIPVIAATVTAAIVISMFEDSMITCGYSDYVENPQMEEIIERVMDDNENTTLPEDVFSNTENEAGAGSEVQSGERVEVDTPDLDKVKDQYLKKKGIDAHELKKDVYGKKAKVAEYDIYVNKKTGQLFTQRKPEYNRKNEKPIPIDIFIK